MDRDDGDANTGRLGDNIGENTGESGTARETTANLSGKRAKAGEVDNGKSDDLF